MHTISTLSHPNVAGPEVHRQSADNPAGNVNKHPSVKPSAHALLDGLKSVRTISRALVESGRTPVLTPSATPHVLARAVGPRELTLEQHPDGKTRITMKYPPIEQLVLSGGGAKGAAYPGAVLALEEGGVMPAIKGIAGSSAGAITAALIASGVSGSEFKDLSNRMDFLDLVRDRVGSPQLQVIRHFYEDTLKEAFAKIGRHVPFARNIGSSLALLSNMRTEAPALEKLLKDETRASVLKHIATHPAITDHRPVIDEIRHKLEAGGDVTFGDLRRLSQCIPAIKNLQCTGTLMESQCPQLMVFSAETTPDLSIARAACISGAFPFVFAQPEETTPFGTARFQDGGVMLNVPAPEIFEPKSVSQMLPNPNSLVLTFTNVLKKNSSPGQGVLGALKDSFVGAPVGARHALQTQALWKMKEDVVQVPLKNERGDFSGLLSGTLNFGMSLDDKLALQRDLKQVVENHLAVRREKQISIELPSTESALLALDDAQFDALRAAHPDLTATSYAFRTEARNAIDRLSTVLRAQDNVTPDSLAQLVCPLDRLCHRDSVKLDHVARQILDPRQPKALARCVDVMRHARTDSPVLQALNVLSEQQDVVNAAHNAIRDIVYPARFKLGQSAGNHALLNLVEDRLTSATTRDEYNAALETLARNYKARLSLRSTPSTSATVELATAYTIPA
ncbi:patatin-like phospholipase family protein [Burkholderia sp. AW49-1]